MNILVCIKQVPDTDKIKIDPVTNTLIRAGVPSIVNPFDRYALECAARIKDENPGTKITVLTMGPAQAKTALQECLSVGADKAFLVSDRLFGGADTLATSYTLAKAIEYIEKNGEKFDIVFCGKQAIDGDTAQVGPEIAEHLDIPQITYAVEAALAGDKIKVKRENDDGYEIMEAQLPALVTVTKPAFEPRMPKVKDKIAALRAEISVISAADIEADVKMLGLKGSPTKVKKSFTPPVKQGGIIVDEGSIEASVKKLAEFISAAI